MKKVRGGRTLAGLTAALLLCLAWASPGEAGIGVTVSPSRFRLSKPAGETASGKILIQNSGSYPVKISTEVMDMVSRPDEKGLSIRDEAPAGSTSHSCASWIRIVQEGALVIPAGQSSDLEFVVSPPPEVTAGGYGAYLFILGQPAENLSKSGKSGKPEVQLVTVPRLGISVVYEVKGTVQRKGDLTHLDFTPPTASEPLKIRHGFVNTGNAEVVLTGTFHILNESNLLVGKGTLRTLKTFPGEKAFMETSWEQSLPAGRYKMLLTFELGPDSQEAVVREINFEVPAS